MHNDVNQSILSELRRQNRLLKQIVTIGGATIAVFILTAATSESARGKFSEIDVGRINIVNSQEKKELVIANRERIPGPVVDGNEVKREGAPRPGIIFYNAVGDESGGLIFDGKLDEKGRPVAGMHFSMDRFGGDQQVALGQYEQNGSMSSGLNIYDRGLAKDYAPLWTAYQGAPAGASKTALLQKWKDAGGEQTQRLFVGKTPGKSSAVILADAQGHPKIMMTVTPEGQPSLDFYGDDGKVLMHLPQVAPVAASENTVQTQKPQKP